MYLHISVCMFLRVCEYVSVYKCICVCPSSRVSNPKYKHNIQITNTQINTNFQTWIIFLLIENNHHIITCLIYIQCIQINLQGNQNKYFFSSLCQIINIYCIFETRYFLSCLKHCTENKSIIYSKKCKSISQLVFFIRQIVII